MHKHTFRTIAAALLLVIVLAACGGAPTGAAGTQAVPQTGSTLAATAGAVVNQAAACLNVDTQQLMAGGQALYTESCAGCHGGEGQGMGSFPGLANNPNVTADDVTSLVAEYFAVDAHPKTLSADDLAAVVTYMRGAFGNTASAVCPENIVIPMP